MEQSENNVYIKMPEDTEKIIKRLHDAGYSAFVVGGCVRDVLQGIEPHDWDVCTSAHPDEVQHIFKDCTVIPTGIKHGTVTVLNTEVTTFRREGKYTDGRHPDSVAFVKDIKEDLFRRDFTVNAMAYSPYEGLVDPFGGQEDLKNGILRCVSEPHRCFSDDALRILRAVRFMSTKGFKADEAAATAVKSDYRLLKNISMERIRDEFVKFLCGDGAADLLDEYREVFCFIIPELKAMIGFDQRSPYHNRDVWHHTLCAVADIPPEPVLRVTMLLHDIAKPVVCIIDDNGRGRFQGHPAKGAEMAEVILRRMKFSKKIINHVVTLIRYHDLKIKPERSDVRRWLGRMGRDIFDELMYVRHADASGKYEKYLGEAEMKNARLTEIADEIEASGDCTDLKGLAVDGSDVRKAGYSGADTGKALEWLLEEVITERVPNEKEALLAALNRKEIFNLCQNGV
jgi:tRNA nucleotidyltransferase (CCA-adding enzyme)